MKKKHSKPAGQAKVRRIGKVLLDATQDRSRDQYSDGDIEAELLAAVRAGRQDEMLRQDTRWPVLYHFSEERQNVLSWLPLTKEEDVLEIGCGCGAVTGAICRRAGHVDAVEISPRRAEIAAWRNKDCANLVIHVGNLNDLAFERKYDVVTLIGVLEYAGTFTHTADPYHDFLAQCQSYLKPGGRLVIAIENRLGMKYWSGAHEDHTGRRFDGILDYPWGGDIRTFSRQELARLLADAGFPAQQWYYPFPDYKFPFELHSDRDLPTPEEMKSCENPTYDLDRWEIFPERDALASVIPAGLYPEFANSFLVVCSGEAMEPEALPCYVHYARYRRPSDAIGTAIYEQDGQRSVVKFARTPAARAHLRAMEENGRILAEMYGKEHVVASHLQSPDVLVCEYAEGESFASLCLRAIQERGLDGFLDCVNFFAAYLVRGQEQTAPTKMDIYAPGRRYDVDLTFENVILKDGNFKIIDYEFLAQERCQLYAILHMLMVFRDRHEAEWNAMGLDEDMTFFQHAYQMDKADWKAFCKDERAFYQTLLDFLLMQYQRQRQQVVS